MKRLGPHLERLEDRGTPTTVSPHAGVLAISHPAVVAGATSVTLDQVAPNSFLAFDDGVPGVVRDGVKATRHTSGPTRDTVTLRLNGFAFSGSASFDTGAEDDTVTIVGGDRSLGRALPSTAFRVTTPPG